MIVKLLVVQGRPAGKHLFFGPGEYCLGRGPECQVRFNSDWVSRQHCLLRVGRDQAHLRDLSRNGTLVNGALISGDHRLEDGDQVQIGAVVFGVGLESEAPPDAQDGQGTVMRGEETTTDHPAGPPLDSTLPHPVAPPPKVPAPPEK